MIPPPDAFALTRRRWLSGALAGAGQLVFARTTGAFARQSAGQAWGVQLYTVRGQIAKDAAATLKRVAAIGYTEIEILQPTLTTIAPLAKQFGLSMVSAHLDGPTAAGEGLAQFIAEAKTHGLRYLVVPFVPPAQRPADRAGVQALAGRLSRMAREVTAAGLQLSFHNHAFEFGRDRDGTSWLDILMQETAGSGMTLQLDVFWVAITGANPVEIIRRYAGRISSLHLKDKDPAAAVGLVESHVPRTAFVEVGSGALDFRAILAAAGDAGIRHYFVEQDQTPGDPVESLAKSYAYLAGLGAR